MVFFSLGFFFRWIALSYLSRWMMLNVFSLRIFKMNLKFASLTFFFALSSTCWWEKTLNAPSTVIDCNIYLWHAFHWQSDLLLVLFFASWFRVWRFFFYFFFAGSVRHWWKPIDLNWSLEGNGFNHELSSQHLNISFFYSSFVRVFSAKMQTDRYWQQSTTALNMLKWFHRTIHRISTQFASFSTRHIYLSRSIRCENAFRHNETQRFVAMWKDRWWISHDDNRLIDQMVPMIVANIQCSCAVSIDFDWMSFVHFISHLIRCQMSFRRIKMARFWIQCHSLTVMVWKHENALTPFVAIISCHCDIVLPASKFKCLQRVQNVHHAFNSGWPLKWAILKAPTKTARTDGRRKKIPPWFMRCWHLLLCYFNSNSVRDSSDGWFFSESFSFALRNF